MTGKRWTIPDLTPAQRRQALKLRETKDENHTRRMSWRKIAKIIGIPERRLLAYFCPAQRLQTLADTKLAETRKSLGMRSPPLKVIIPAHVIAERDRAYQYTQNLLGDPLPGRSAYDRMQQQKETT